MLNSRQQKKQLKGQAEAKKRETQAAKSDPETPTDSEESDSVDEEPRSAWSLPPSVIINKKPAAQKNLQPLEILKSFEEEIKNWTPTCLKALTENKNNNVSAPTSSPATQTSQPI